MDLVWKRTDGRKHGSLFRQRGEALEDVFAFERELEGVGDAGHRGPVNAAVFLADGRVVTAGQDQTLRCWDPKTGKEVDRLGQQSSYMQQLIADADGQSVFFASNNLNVPKWTPSKTLDAERVTLSAQGGMTFLAPDAKSAVVQFNQTLTAFSMPDGKQLHQLTAAAGKDRRTRSQTEIGNAGQTIDG